MDRTACIFGCAGARLSESERHFFEEIKPLGFILFSRNGDRENELRRLIHSLEDSVGESVLILTDHEGGRVQRFTGPDWYEWLPPFEQCQAIVPAKRLRSLWLRYRIIAAELRAVGINVNCVPVADIATNVTHNVLYNRCYATDPGFVSAAAHTVAEACIAGGILPVIKHIPGHGRPHADSHLQLPVTDAALTELAESDFIPFRRLNRFPLGMMAHVLYLSLDGQCPSSQSEGVISYVRDVIGFDGLLMSDDLSMSALSGNMGERAMSCISAGCDVNLHCNGDLAEMQDVAAASGKLGTAGSLRAHNAFTSFCEPDRDEIAVFVEEFQTICLQSGVQWPP